MILKLYAELTKMMTERFQEDRLTHNEMMDALTEHAKKMHDLVLIDLIVKFIDKSQKINMKYMEKIDYFTSQVNKNEDVSSD